MMVIVGGSGFFFGPFLGAMVAVLLPEWLRFTEGYYLMLYAIVVILLLIYSPTGVLGILDRYLPERRTRIGVGAACRRAIAAADEPRPMTRVLEVSDMQQTVWRHHRRRRRQLSTSMRARSLASSDPTAAASPRVQLHPRPAHAERRRGEGRRQSRHRHCGPANSTASASAGRSSFCRCSRQLVGARKSDPRRAGASGHHAVAAVRPVGCGTGRRPPIG